jgi:hypothetical protein
MARRDVVWSAGVVIDIVFDVTDAGVGSHAVGSGR